jgi:hypothetical protein
MMNPKQSNIMKVSIITDAIGSDLNPVLPEVGARLGRFRTRKVSTTLKLNALQSLRM